MIKNDKYYHWYNQTDTLRMKYPSEFVIGFLLNNVVKGSKVLDLGCGSGRHAMAAAELGYEAHASDLSQDGLDHCSATAEKNGLKVQTHKAYMNNTNYSDSSFDAVICYSAINGNNIKDIQDILTEIKRILKPNGALLINFYGTKDVSYLLGTQNGEKIEENTFLINGPEFHSFDENTPSYLAHFSTEDEVNSLLEDFSTKKIFEQYLPFGNCRLENDAAPTHLIYAVAQK